MRKHITNFIENIKSTSVSLIYAFFLLCVLNGATNIVTCLEESNFFELGMLLSPMPPSQFLDEIFGKKVLYLSQKNATLDSANYRRHLFETADIENTFLKQVNQSKINRVTGSSYTFVKDDQDVRFDCGDNDDCKNELQRRFQAKETLLMQSVEDHVLRLKKVKCALEVDLAASVGINVYWSPPNTTGFKLHHDGHDILVVQNEGRKCWLVCEKKLKEESLSANSVHYQNKLNSIESELGVTCRNITMKAGDVLYLPRGVLHAPHTHECGNNIHHAVLKESLHTSIGIDVYSSRWASLFQNLVLVDDSSKTEKEETCNQGNAKTLIFPKLPGATWTWEDVLKGYFMEAVDTNTASGHAMRENIPLWKFGQRYISRTNNFTSTSISIFRTGNLVENMSDWKSLKSDFNEKINILSKYCGQFLRSALVNVLIEFDLTNKVIEEKIGAASSQCSFILHGYSKRVNFLFAVNKILGYIFSGHNQRCTDLPTSSYIVNPGEYLIEVNSLSELMSFSKGGSLPLLHSDLCNNDAALISRSYYYGSVMVMATNVDSEAEHEKSESIIFFGPRGQTLINRSAASAIIKSMKMMESTSNMSNTFCDWI